MAIAEAQGHYLSTLLKQLGGSYEALRDYIMLTNGSYKEIAKINAQAVHGLNPRISIWSGANSKGGEGSSAMKDVAAIVPDCAGADWDAATCMAWYSPTRGSTSRKNI